MNMEKKLTASMVDFITNARQNTQMTWSEIYEALNAVYQFISDAYDPGAALAKMYKRYVDAQCDWQCNGNSKTTQKAPERKVEQKQVESVVEQPEKKDELDEIIENMSDEELILTILACDKALGDLTNAIEHIEHAKYNNALHLLLNFLI